MDNVQVVNISSSDITEQSIQFSGSVHEVHGPAVSSWYSVDAIKRAKKKLNAERIRLAREQAIVAQYRRATNRLRVERAKLQAKLDRLERMKKLVWVKPKKAPKKARGRNAPVGHPDMAKIVLAQRVKIVDLIKKTQKEVLAKLPRSSALRKLSRDQIRSQVEGFTQYLIKKIAQLRELISLYFDYDKVTGGTVDHVERLVTELKNVLYNVDKYVLGQLDQDTRCTKLHHVGNCPAHWNSQMLLVSLEGHLDKEREVLSRLANSYIAVSRAPPVIPPWHPPTSVKSWNSQEL